MQLISNNEAERVKALRHYEILDSGFEPEFDRLTEVASLICGVPISLIALVEESRQWFKSKKGMVADQTNRDISFCHYAIMKDDILQVEDAHLDDRFKNNPLVTGDPHIRFYAGYPLIDPNGYALGSLCVIDRTPKKLEEHQQRALRLLTEEVVEQIVARKERKDLKNLERLFNLTTDMISISARDGHFKKINPSFYKTLGRTEADLMQSSIPGDLSSLDPRHSFGEFKSAGAESIATNNFTNRITNGNGSELLIDWVTNLDTSTGLMYGIGRDITEQKKTETDLIRTRDMLDATSQVAQVGGWEVNAQTQKVWWSPVTKKIFEADADFIPTVTKSVSFFLDEDNKDKIRLLFDKAAEDGISFDDELQITTAKNNVRWLRVIGKPKIDPDQAAIVYGTCQDITDQKNREQLISLSEKRFRQTFYHAAIGMFLSDPATGSFIEVNEAFSQVTGYSKSELFGMNFRRITHPDDLASCILKLKYLLTAKVSTIEIKERLVTKYGDIVWIELTASVVRDENGAPLNVIGQVQNITERIDAERKLQLSEERHRGFFENSQGLMCTHDLSGNFLTVNPAGANLLGYTTEEVLQKSLYDIVAPEHKSMVTEYLAKIESTGHYDGLMKVLHKNGEHKTWYYKNVLSELIDGRKYVIGNAVDISERIVMERSLHKAKELAVKNAQAKDVFLANMSHEIRTPMNAITGFANLLKDSQLDHEQSRYVSYINTASENLLGIINDILDFSKIESGHISFEAIPFNVKELVKNVKVVLSHKGAEKHLFLRYSIDNNIPDYLTGDPTRLNQVLLNLANNAIKFTEQGSVEIKVILEKEMDHGCLLHFTITDTGIGISEDKLDTIFNRFTQADSDTTRKYGGTGLGLSISKSLVEEQGGDIWVESTVNQGSAFHFTLTFLKVDPAAIIKKTGQFKRLYSERKVKVLLVEDNILNQKLALKVLENFNFLPELAENGRVAIDMIRQNDYEVILMDLQMPEMDGYQATEAIRNELKIDTPIIAMTAHSLVGEKDKCIATGMNDYIPKPFVADEVYSKILHYATAGAGEPPAQNEKIQGRPLVDLSYLKSLSGGIVDFEQEMIELFLKQTPYDMDLLQKAVEQVSYIDIKKMAHKLVSSFALMGINEENILKYLEEQSGTVADADLLLYKFNQLKALFQQAVKYLQDVLAAQTI